MRLPMVDCRSLIEFCRTFEQHQKLSDSVHSRGRRIRYRGLSGKKKRNELNPTSHPLSFCDHSSSLAAIDAILLFLVLGALGLLTFPSLRLVLRESSGASAEEAKQKAYETEGKAEEVGSRMAEEGQRKGEAAKGY